MNFLVFVAHLLVWGYLGLVIAAFITAVLDEIYKARPTEIAMQATLGPAMFLFGLAAFSIGLLITIGLVVEGGNGKLLEGIAFAFLGITVGLAIMFEAVGIFRHGREQMTPAHSILLYYI